MKRLLVGMDIDGVIVDYVTAMLPLLSEICGRPVLYGDLISSGLREALNMDEESVSYVFNQLFDGGLLRHAPPINGAIDGLQALGEHDIWLVTGRPVSAQSLTESWLQENNVEYARLVFTGRGDKLKVGPGFDVFVEDFIEEACILAEAGIFTLLLDQPWNQGPIPSENCRRVYDWNTIVLLINKFEKA